MAGRAAPLCFLWEAVKSVCSSQSCWGAQENSGLGFVLLVAGCLLGLAAASLGAGVQLCRFRKGGEHRRVNFEGLLAGRFLVWLLPGIERQTINVSWYQDPITSLSSVP